MTMRRNTTEYARQALLAVRADYDRLPIFYRPLPSALYSYVTVADVDMLRAAATDPALGLSAIADWSNPVPRLFRSYITV